ncbi:hypothetical protein HK105_208650 [Polyrhizophydium stewartii]|uniref:Uncharacterized protein n=1 Tax=Polyrhizophydium stewartii TaxID=2732419 RepID=A0ABR4MXB3_9FUNG
MCQPAALREILKRELGQLDDHIVAIERITRRNTTVFRVAVNGTHIAAMRRILRKARGRMHWTVTAKSDFVGRPAAERPEVQLPVARCVVSINVCGLRSKRDDVRSLVRDARLFALQETNIKPSDFLFTVPGFNVFQHPAIGEGRRGIALGIPRQFAAQECHSVQGILVMARVANFTEGRIWKFHCAFHVL